MSAPALRKKSRSRRCPNDGRRWLPLPLVEALVLPLVLLTLAGCRSPRPISLRSMGSALAWASTATPGLASPAPQPGAETEDPRSTEASLATPGQEDSAGSLQQASHLEAALGPAEPQEAGADNRSKAEGSPSESQDLRERVREETLPAPLDDAAVDGAGDQGDDDPAEPSVAGTPQGQTPAVDLQAVLVSATESYPAIREASLLRSLAIGDQIAALGEFDDKLEAFTINQPLGFYENYRHGLGWKKPRLLGGTTYAGYRIGDGNFEPWYGERETDEGGEFSAGFDIPLLQNRAIDPRRTAVRLASLDIRKANPELFQQVLLTQFEAASAYWAWLAAAKQYQISLELMRLAEQRVERIESLIAAGDVARIVGIDNRRLLALRRERLIEAKQKLDTNAIKLSLYYRDPLGRPVVLKAQDQPPDFPPLPSAAINVDAEVARALANRPELQILQISDEQVRAELRLAINQRLPELSFSSEISQDVGGLTSSKGDKQPFKLEAGLIGSVPVQRRKAIGKAQALRAKIAQLDAKRQLTGDKIANEVRQAATIYDAAIARLEQAQITRELAQQTLSAGEISFAAGDIDILMLNIYEQAFADAGIDIILAQADLLSAEAMLITATGRSLLEIETPAPNLIELPGASAPDP